MNAITLLHPDRTNLVSAYAAFEATKGRRDAAMRESYRLYELGRDTTHADDEGAAYDEALCRLAAHMRADVLRLTGLTVEQICEVL